MTPKCAAPQTSTASRPATDRTKDAPRTLLARADKIHVGMQGGIGGGYRFHIAPRFKIDLTVGYNFLQKHGEVIVPHSDYSMIQNAKYNGHAFTFGVGFSF